MLFMVPFKKMINYEAWDRIQMTGIALRLVHNRFASDAMPSGRFTQRQENFLHLLEVVLRVYMQQRREELCDIIQHHPCFQHHFKGSKQITEPQVAFREDRLFWVLSELAGRNYQSTKRTDSWCFAFVEKHLATRIEKRGRE